MDIAVFADLHTNHIAFEECLGRVREQGIETFIFLGDYIGELAYPQKTMEMLYDLAERYDCYFVRGNKEEYWLNHEKGLGPEWRDGDSTTGALKYAYEELTGRDLDFFADMKTVDTLHFENLPLLVICHGSPESVRGKMKEDEATYVLMEACEADYILCGHTHEQKVIVHGGKTAINPGSVGVPQFSGGHPQFAILHGRDSRWEYELVTISYDVERVVAELEESGLMQAAPSWSVVTKHLLRVGNISHSNVLDRAMELCREKEGECNWPEIPEKYWEMAVREKL